jgi:lipoprotein-anchoring transpeptidase ErfK/SrfK
MKRRLRYLFALTTCLMATGCVVQPTSQNNNSPVASPSPTAIASPSPSPEKVANAQPLTLPVLDAFFADESFSSSLKTHLHLSDEQITRLKELAHSETAKLNENTVGKGEQESAEARSVAAEKISAVIGREKTEQLATLVAERWNSNSDDITDKTAMQPASPNNRDAVASAPDTVPRDSRIVVNAPAYRMDVFDNGRLIKSYKIGIGYPQFPLPTGLRKARVIIFNPTWTPPDEAWVAKMKDVSAGQKVDAGSKLNPLGPIKIPIGGPSLIHGGKSPAKLGTFASHGCVGLTTPQIRDFAKLLAQLGGAQLTDAELADYTRDKTRTRQIKLEQPVPVELRYETIVVEDGKLHIYRDVYDQETNTEENLRAVLEANGVQLDDLTEGERAEVFDALAQMSGKTGAIRPVTISKENASPFASPRLPAARNSKSDKKPTSVARNQKEVVIEIATLKGKGYPSPVALDTGAGKSNAAMPSASKSGRER